jgi:hypothetical protein
MKQYSKKIIEIILFIFVLFIFGCGPAEDAIISHKNNILSTKTYSTEINRYKSDIKINLQFNNINNEIQITPIQNIMVDSQSVKKDSIHRIIKTEQSPESKEKMYLSLVLPLAWPITIPQLIGNLFFNYGTKDEYFSEDNIIKRWTTVVKSESFANQSFGFIKNDGALISLLTNNEGIIVTDIKNITNESLLSVRLGQLIVLENKYDLNASLNICSYFINKYASENDWDKILFIINEKSMPQETLSLAKSLFGKNRLALLESLLLKENYRDAIKEFNEMSRLDINTYEVRNKMKILPKRFFQSYDLAKSIFLPEFRPPYYIGEAIEMQGRVSQIIPGTGMLFLPATEKYNNWYCTVSSNDMISNLIDDAYITFIGIYKGSKSYQTVLGATKTVPWIEILSIKRIM